MPLASAPLKKLGFLTIGVFDGDDPRPGHESLLRVIELGEELGFDSAWLRHRHLQYGVSSPIAIMAAATQRTSRIELGTAVTPLAWENPLRLAEDLATVDILSGGRLNPGISVGTPMNWDRVKDALYPDTADVEDFGYGRVERLLGLVRGDPASDFSGVQGIEVFSDRVQPHSAGLIDRMWYGAASVRSAQWAGEHGLNLLASSVVRVEGTPGEAAGTDAAEQPSFEQIQLSHIQAFRQHHPDRQHARVSQGLVVIPTDSATPEQRRKYEQYVAARTPRTTKPQGPAQLLFAVDLVGTADRIAEELYAHLAFQQVDEVAFALPFSFEHDDYVQILTDIATRLGPALGWRPATRTGS
jgi:alkanesulfonate monooxygenase SsuD/methylene tetrahydromethanopterin reductase-like flavin-dependent oxidoreductase (luciferase family)